MKNLLYKELSLCLPLQVPLFFLFAVMIMIPNYPYLVAGFFICNAIFYSFAQASADNDTLFSLLLPISKEQIVRGKMLFVICVQLLALVFFAGVTVVNFFVHKNAGNSAGVSASLTLLGEFLILFSVFNLSYIPKYYKTPHNAGRIFLVSTLAVFVYIFVAEGFMIAAGAAKDAVPFFSWINANLNTFPTTATAWVCQAIFFAVCAVLYASLNIVCTKKAVKSFDMAEI